MTERFRSRYAARAGIEETHEQPIRRCRFRQCRSLGEAKAHLQHILTAAAINVVRLSEWWAGTPLAKTRCSRFAALQPGA
jgi:transposase